MKANCIVEFSPAEFGDCIWSRKSSLGFLDRFARRIGGRLETPAAAKSAAEDLSNDLLSDDEAALLAAGALCPDRVRRLLEQ